MDAEKRKLEQTRIIARAGDRMHRAEQQGITTRYAIKYGCLAFCAVCATLSSYFLGGDATVKVVQAVATNLASDPAGKGTPWFVTAIAVLYGLLQRKLRRDHIEKAGGKFKALEQTVDPNRSSSNLTTRGETAPGDRT